MMEARHGAYNGESLECMFAAFFARLSPDKMEIMGMPKI
jgi:hypothetical protein